MVFLPASSAVKKNQTWSKVCGQKMHMDFYELVILGLPDFHAG